MLSLESTSSRMSNLARQEIYFDRQFSLDETIERIERVTGERCAAGGQGAVRQRLDGRNGGGTAGRAGAIRRGTGPWIGRQSPRHKVTDERHTVIDERRSMIARYTHPEMGRIWTDSAAMSRGSRSRRRRPRRSAAGLIPAEAARDPRARRVRHRADRGDRGDDPARRDRFHDGRRRKGRAFRTVAPLRAHLLRCRRHRAGAAAASTRATSSLWTSSGWPTRPGRVPTSTGTRR